MYYEKVIEAVKGGKFITLRATFESLASDAGLHQLVPYFTQFVAHEVTNNLTKLSYLSNLMEMVKSLLINPHLHVELYVCTTIILFISKLVASINATHTYLSCWENINGRSKTKSLGIT